MKISFNNQINFGKQLMANCTVLKNKEQIPCKIYELTLDDFDYFSDKKKNKEWRSENIWKSARFDFVCSMDLKLSNFYVLEDEQENCLALADVSKIPKNSTYQRGGGLNLCYLASLPNREEKGYEYIGETFINFFCSMVKKEKLQTLLVSKPLEKAMPFYKKCNFKPCVNLFLEKGAISLKGKNMEKLIAQNEEHTGSKIDCVF